ncbi:hypothetical protein ACFL6E_04615 [Candidatus Neomarinimicrobiota bacterium]
MAKATKTFASKVHGLDEKVGMKHVRVIQSVKNPATGGVKFMDRVIAVPEEGDIKDHVGKFLKEAN